MSSNALDGILRELYSAGSFNDGRSSPSVKYSTLDELESAFPVLRSSVWHGATACVESFRLPSKGIRKLAEELVYGLQLICALKYMTPPVASAIRNWLWIVSGFLGRLSGTGGGAGVEHLEDASSALLPSALYSETELESFLEENDALAGEDEGPAVGPSGQGWSGVKRNRLTRLEDIAPLAQAALTLAISPPTPLLECETTMDGEPCPFTALVTASLSLLKLSLHSHANPRKALGLLLIPGRVLVNGNTGGAESSSLSVGGVGEGGMGGSGVSILALLLAFRFNGKEALAGDQASSPSPILHSQMLAGVAAAEGVLFEALFFHKEVLGNLCVGGLAASVPFVHHACATFSSGRSGQDEEGPPSSSDATEHAPGGSHQNIEMPEEREETPLETLPFSMKQKNGGGVKRGRTASGVGVSVSSSPNNPPPP